MPKIAITDDNPVAPESESESEPSDPLQPYCNTRDILAEKLVVFYTLQHAQSQLQDERDKLSQERETLLKSLVIKGSVTSEARSEAEEQLIRVDLRKEVMGAQLEFTTEQTIVAEDALYAQLHHVHGAIHSLWRAFLSWTRDREFKAIELCVHKEFRQLQRLTIEQLVMISTGVMSYRSAEVGVQSPPLSFATSL